ncbi:Dipeptidyl peptidase 9 [Camellia lanceoleosa]|uniref:Dipeptidyl peptidase 9 n=1 Tax=Camellia lanceoleosa TaxID=1840588 RepID=A0ACC0H4M5_9ERIC|nr:Dipeptidyl peptidase 9 [Camellia lanceoleosa]
MSYIAILNKKRRRGGGRVHQPNCYEFYSWITEEVLAAGSLKHNVGRIDAEDQLTGAKWLIKQGLANVDHIGLYGWSYGGYLSAMTLARFPDIFRCAVSGAPVTSWDGYDTFYTEKYMGLPSENREGYEFSSVMRHVDNIEGKLLLVHGMIDENVHFRHTSRLVNALVEAGKPYELLIFPDERHMPRRLRDRMYMEERIWDFIERNL